MPTIQIIQGEPVKGRWGQWFRHDTVVVDGTPLKGSIVTRRRYYGKRLGHRIDVHTGIGSTAVMGKSVDWLIAMNRKETTSP